MEATDPRVGDFLERNKEYTKQHAAIPTIAELAKNPGGPALVVISCFDARIQPQEFLGFKSAGEVNVLKNAGGRVDPDTIRSLIVLDNIVRVRTVMVVHHTDCGMTYTTDQKLRGQLKAKAPEMAQEIDAIKDFGIFSDVEQSVRDDIAVVRASPYLKHVDVKGFVYNIEHGGVEEVK